MANEKLPDCCKKDSRKESTGLLAGVVYGLVPHIGCIAFIIFSVLGATMAASFFKPLLLSGSLFYWLIALSFVFATISAVFYLKKHQMLSVVGAAQKWKYLSVLYSTTIIVNLIMFTVVFPYAANISPINSATGDAVRVQAALFDANTQAFASTDGKLTLQVGIPCSGHASLIMGELRTINGVGDVKFRLPDKFDVSYDPAKASASSILGLDVFKEYPAKLVG